MAAKVAIALHGFLGRPQDWQVLQEAFPQYQWINVDYLNIQNLKPQDFNLWSVQFKKWIDDHVSQESEKVLFGYSLGGRLALHTILNFPNYFQKAVFLSTGLGLKDLPQREARMGSDEIWAEKFLKNNWSSVMSEWNAQTVFQGGVTEPERCESDYARFQLAEALLKWSLAKQEDLSLQIAQIQIPTYWFAGENDAKYCQLLEVVRSQMSSAKTQVIKQVGHRLLLESPQQVANYLQDYLK